MLVGNTFAADCIETMTTSQVAASCPTKLFILA